LIIVDLANEGAYDRVIRVGRTGGRKGTLLMRRIRSYLVSLSFSALLTLLTAAAALADSQPPFPR
jgi:hypothetical protein